MPVDNTPPLAEIPPTEPTATPPGFFRGDSSSGFSAEMQCQLKRRLRGVTWILVAGMGAFLLRNVYVFNFTEATTYRDSSVFLWVHAASLMLIALPLLPLHRSCEFRVWKLRLMEILVFGSAALFFVWIQLHAAWHVGPDAVQVFTATYPAESAIRWIILVQLYALYVPVATRCTTTNIVVLTLMPLIAAVIGARALPELHDVLFRERMFSAMVLWLSISAAIAIYRTMRLGHLHREVYDAQRLGAYTLKEKIGSGGMGEVYRAEHALLKRPAAIKLVRGDRIGEAGTLARFEDEVQAAACLTHPNTIEIYDYGRTDDGTFYYVMEFLPGLSLQQIVERFGPLPPERAVHLLRQIASALREAHLCGMVHRDVKPSNVLVTERGRVRDVAKLLDFGLVKTTAQSDVKLTMDGAIVGSPLYAAPETASDVELDARSDLYSLGATAFYLLAGRPVFEGTNPLKVLFAHVHDPAPSLADVEPSVPPDLAALVDRCLRKDPADRFPSADAFLTALDACTPNDRWTTRDAEQWWTDHTVRPANSSFTPIEETLLVASHG